MNNKNNIILADELDNISLNIANIDSENSNEILLSIEKALKHIDSIAQDMDISSLRALAHWMLLNTEKTDSNNDRIKELSSSGSYVNWIEILSAVLQYEDESLLTELHTSLDSPSWIIKPSSLLLNDFIAWVEKTTNTTFIPNSTDLASNNNVITPTTAPEEPLESSNPEKIAIDINTDSYDEETPIETTIKETKNTTIDECLGNLGLELDELVIDLLSLSSNSEDVLKDSDKFSNKLEHLNIFAKKCSYHDILVTTRWCQRNLDLFARNNSQQYIKFIESGEAWSWIELLAYCINEPEEPSNLSLLSTELTRQIWIEPITGEELKNLLLFIRDPKEHKEQNIATNLVTDKDTTAQKPKVFGLTNQEDNTNSNKTNNDFIESETKLSFTWDKDIHPELLEAYFQETPDLVSEITVLLHRITKGETSKEDHQHASRVAHTIKGGSAVLGITALSEYSHKLEDILDYSINNNLSKETSDFLAESSDCLERLFDAIQKQQSPPKEFAQILGKLSVFAENLNNEDPLDESLLELTEPVLPDFIKQTIPQNEIKEKAISQEEIKDESLVSIPLTDLQDISSISETDQESPDTNSNDIQEFSEEVDDIIMSLAMIIDTQGDTFKNIEKAQEELQRLDLLSEISGYPEVSKISLWCQSNLKHFEAEKADNSKEFIESGECWTWIELISASLIDPEEKSYLSLLSQELMREEWLKPINKEDLQAIILLLNNTKTAEENNVENDNQKNEVLENNSNNSQEEKPSNTSELNSSTLTLRWDEDIHPELLSIYLQETPEQVADVTQLIHKITKNEANKEDHQHAARLVHTIKGASGVVGITALAEFTHKLEDILDHSVNNKLSQEVSQLLTEAADCLEELLDAIINKEPEPQEFSPLLARLTVYAKSLTHDQDDFNDESALKMPELPDFIKAQDTSSTSEPIINSPAPSRAEITSAEETPSTKEEKISENTTGNQPPATETHIRIPITVIDKLLNLAGELVTTTTQVSDKIQHSITTNKKIKTQDQHVHDMLNELSKTISKQEKNQTRANNSLENTDFDSLEMDTYNELHSITGLLTESIFDSEEIDNKLGLQLSELTEHTRSLELLNKEISDLILHSRMVSIDKLIPRLERIIRQTCRKTGKKAELAITGNEINIDTDIFNKLIDPLLHLLRNSVDHGIEPPEERKAKSKYETGRIHLTFSQESNFIHMELKDDGAGINPDKIYQQALKMGLINKNQEYTKNQILQLILQPGFTTQEKVTDISGRGVGMDVVNDAVKQLKGTLEISSEKGQGTIFTIKAPLTLVTSATLIVEIAEMQVAIPAESVEQLFQLAPNMVQERDEAKFFEYKNEELPIISLASLLNWPVTTPDFSTTNSILLINTDNKIHAIYIDKIIQSREIVIKSLAPWITPENGIIGACHLPDGGVAPVLDLPRLLNRTGNTNTATEKFQLSTFNQESIKEKTPQVLVVDDSLSNRKALSLIIEQTEYDVLTAVDGLDALEIMNENQIDIVFTDLEMPRMNGLELTQSIRAWEAKKHIPVIMITSRTTNKHKQLAVKAGINQYLTKPVISDILLNSLEHWLKQPCMAESIN